MPETYVQAVVSVEDHRFYEHFGLDLIAIGRALVNDIKAGRYVEGGSTITQQLAKNLYFSQEKTMNRFTITCADECFLTGTAAECVPVTKLDGYQLGSGKIGPVTARILARFQELAQTTGTSC